MNTFAEQLKTVRCAAGMTQAQLAKKAAVSRTTVQAIEAGTVDPGVGTLLSMARVLGLEPLLVPAWLKEETINFIRSGGRVIGQPPGVGAPLSVVDQLLRTMRKR